METSQQHHIQIQRSTKFWNSIRYSKNFKPDIIFGTDPDCDRIGVVVKDSEGNYRVLNGNQTGLLLTEYILSALKEENNFLKWCCNQNYSYNRRS